jgi:hypothetical protein
MATQEFQFKFTMITVTVTIDDVYLTVKQGLRTWQVELSRLRNLYMLTHPNVGLECIVSYEGVDGKLKRIRFNSSFGEQRFSEAVEALIKRRPEIDIRTMPSKEAHKLMGAVNFTRWAPLFVFIIVTAVVIVLFLPGIIHGFDSGSATLEIDKCQAQCPVDSHNVILTKGYLNIDNYVEETTTSSRRGSTTTTVRYFIPYVPVNWQDGDPVYAVVETPQITSAELDTLYEKDVLSCVLRNVLWEGLAGDTKQFFETDIKIKLAPEVRLFEYNADPRNELILAGIIIGASMIIMLVATLIIARRRR